ncbi:MAG: hypothetical protein RL497_2698 [Pseudomonadota bacterium]|jgi:hypothetical protein
MTRIISATAKSERRQVTSNAIPRNIQNYLSQAQLQTLRQMELLGWRLQFVRREASNPPLVVLRHQDSGKFSVLEDTGWANMKPELRLRSVK